MQETECAYTLTTRNHWWFDAGIVGLYFIAIEVKDRIPLYTSIEFIVNPDGLTFRAPSKEILKDFLKDCYRVLADKYWNVSTIKQQESKELVIYYKDEDRLDVLPRRNPTPIPGLFTKGSSFRADSQEYDKLSLDMQKRVDLFLEENHKNLWGKKKRLLYESPVCHPQIELFPIKGRKTTCCICGQKSICSDVSQTSFLLFASPTAALSFNSEIKSTDKICWECDLLSKFAIETAHYKTSDDNLYILQTATSNLNKLINIQSIIGSQSTIRQLNKDNYLSNIGTEKIDNRTLYYARLPYELLWSLFGDTYSLLHSEAQIHAKSMEDLTTFCLKPFIDTPLKIVLFVVSVKGQTFLTKEIITYTETAYVFWLLHSFQQEFSKNHNFLFKVFHDLYIPVKKEKPLDLSNYLWRNRIFQKVLQKKPILQDMEQIAFRKSLLQNFPYIGNLLEFTRYYHQLTLKERLNMNKEQIEIAVNLGKQIVVSAKEATKEMSNSNFDRVKGDLFSLRKTRTVTDFLEQLNRIQFRYNITFSNQILGGILEEPEVSFEDFKSYCLLAALNTYNNYKRPKGTKEEAIN